MIAHEFEYSSATQLSEALTLLADGAKPLAGGMSLVPMMKLRLATPEHVVDIRRIKELNYVKVSPDGVRIGATVTHHNVESSEILRAVCPLLAKTAACIGDVQVRNMGTIGGSVAHADPSADYLAALFALEARVGLASASGERALPISEFILDSFTTALEPGEIIRGDFRACRDGQHRDRLCEDVAARFWIRNGRNSRPRPSRCEWIDRFRPHRRHWCRSRCVSRRSRGGKTCRNVRIGCGHFRPPLRSWPKVSMPCRT